MKWQPERTVDRGLTGELLQHLGGTGQSVTRLADADVQDELLDAELPHGVLGLLRLGIVLVEFCESVQSVRSYHGGGVVDFGAGRLVDEPGIWESEADFRSTNLRLWVWGTPREKRSWVGDKVWRQRLGAVAKLQWGCQLWRKHPSSLGSSASRSNFQAPPPRYQPTCASLRSLHRDQEETATDRVGALSTQTNFCKSEEATL